MQFYFEVLEILNCSDGFTGNVSLKFLVLEMNKQFLEKKNNHQKENL